MANTNAITYHNALTVNGMSYDLVINTPDAKMQADAAKITELFKAVLSSHHDKELNELSLKELTAKIQYSPAEKEEERAKINGKVSNNPIKEVFLEALRGPNYQGTKVADENRTPTVSDAIETMYDIQVTSSISGEINPDMAEWSLAGALGSAVGTLGTVASSAINMARKAFSSDFQKEVVKPQNIAYIKEMCAKIVDEDRIISNEAANFFYNRVVKHLKKGIKEGDPNQGENLKAGLLAIIDLINKEPENADKIKVPEVIEALNKPGLDYFQDFR